MWPWKKEGAAIETDCEAVLFVKKDGLFIKYSKLKNEEQVLNAFAPDESGEAIFFCKENNYAVKISMENFKDAMQISMVYINTLMIQEILAEKQWLDKMETEDFRALGNGQ
jgi:TnpA family transposase